MMIAGIVAVLLIAAVFYAAWTTTGQTPPDGLPECPANQTLSIENPADPVCR